ncbi:beta-phosphoglucomutase [Shewanella baltica]|uniref:beta-phosphoglucomutase n=1 Tax=Shewanella baltica TaxID=62322 RepID=UPI0001530B3A|nr:beta-phosphoglucomutase [Shewanella baltica]ACK47447.1 beta-phosphoglucomutase [Shewanella baltica OS223]
MQPSVIFDLDGVIIDTAHYHYLAWKALADSIDAPFDLEANEALKGIDRMASLRWIVARSDRRFSEDELAVLAERKNHHYQTLIADMQPEDIFPGVRDLLLELRRQGCRVGLASVSKNAAFVLDKLQITHLFDYAADAASIARTKPDPEIFLTVAKALGTPPEHCVGIEDAAAGVEAILAANMPAIGVGSIDILSRANLVVASTQDITPRMIFALAESVK